MVSLSLGSACVFRFGNAESRGKPWQDVTLESGDLFVFGGPARFAYHGVTKTMRGHRTARHRPACGQAEHHAARVWPDLSHKIGHSAAALRRARPVGSWGDARG